MYLLTLKTGETYKVSSDELYQTVRELVFLHGYVRQSKIS